MITHAPHFVISEKKAKMKWAAAAATLLLSAVTDGMMFHSQAVTKEWDTWVFVENNT
jgi:hypothetical protein